MGLPRVPVRVARRAALAAAAGFLLVAAFQVGLALGAPWGGAAWGGRDAGVLSPSLRRASAVAVVVYVGVGLLVLGRAGFWASARGSGLLRWGTWLLAAVLLLGTILNIASSSAWERFGWAPFTLVLATLTFVVACSELPQDDGSGRAARG